MTIAIIVGVLCALIWWGLKLWGTHLATQPPKRQQSKPPRPSRQIRADDIPATWQGQRVSESYRQQIIDEDEEIPF